VETVDLTGDGIDSDVSQQGADSSMDDIVERQPLETTWHGKSFFRHESWSSYPRGRER
jgi:hypothetical protein